MCVIIGRNNMTFHLTSPENIYYTIAAAIAGLGFLWKTGHVMIRWLRKTVVSLKQDRERLMVVFTELTPNHGSSLKDKISKMEKDITRNNELTEKIFYRQRWIMENQEIPIFESDPTGFCTWVNEKYAQFFGKSSTVFLGNGWKNIIHPDDRERVEAHWNECIRDGIDAEDTFRVLAKDRVVKVKVIANKTQGGYIGSILRLD
jgi:PAS domain S-box-containing protein